jgi:putative membrane protein
MLTASDHAALAEAIRAAESTTAGEIYVVVDRGADEFRLVPVLWAACLALLLPWPLVFLTTLPITLVLLAQVALFVVSALVLSWPVLRARLVPPGLADDAAERNARAMFLAHGVHLTEARTGVLIYLSLAPRRIVVLADAGIHARVEEGAWDAMVARIAREAHQGRPVPGLQSAIAEAGALLSRHFPRKAMDRNELPDRVVEI